MFGFFKRDKSKFDITRQYIRAMRAREASDKSILLQVAYDMAYHGGSEGCENSDRVATDLRFIADVMADPKRQARRVEEIDEQKRRFNAALEELDALTKNERDSVRD